MPALVYHLYAGVWAVDFRSDSGCANASKAAASNCVAVLLKDPAKGVHVMNSTVDFAKGASNSDDKVDVMNLAEALEVEEAAEASVGV